MKYEEYLQKKSFSQRELLSMAHGTLIEDPPMDFNRLPTPPMLMVDRITEISRDPARRYLIAEQDIRLDHWYFQSHFLGDPVQPGCLGVDAIWQLLGFYASVCGATGVGRALGCKEVSFFGQIRPNNQIVRYEIEIRRLQHSPSLKTAVIIGYGKVYVDGIHVYDVKDAKVGTFLGIRYGNYPLLGPNSSYQREGM